MDHVLCNCETSCAISTPEGARAEILRVKLGTSAPDWQPCGVRGCHWCEIGAALRHPVLVAALVLPEDPIETMGRAIRASAGR
jgi:hypothetical protein